MSMKQHLIIKNLGPIKNCEIDLTKMIVLDGPQAAGKSTVAKAIFFFRTVKNDIVDSLINPYFDPVVESDIQFRLRNKFTHLFGDNINENTFVSFDYGNGVNVEIHHNRPKQINQKILDWTGKFFDTKLTSNEKSLLYREASKLFSDDKEIVYINRITKLRSVFKSPEKLIFADNGTEVNPEFLSLIREKMWRILQGKYKYLNGEEFLQLFDKDSKKIKIKFASSGQQEVLWILNLIYYYILKQKPTCFIIEEPEAHLYPNSQKEITEYIALALSEKNDCVLTTHSPYILGTLSNLLDARRMMDEGYNITRLLERENLTATQLLKQSDFSAYFVSEGTLNNAVDEENGLIKNELIDGASDKINGFADDLMYLEREGKNNVG